MTQFSVNTHRFDPYKNFKFRVKVDGRYVAGISKVSGLKRTTEVVRHRTGGDPSSSRKSPGRSEFEAVTLERGVTHDPEFERWANGVWNFGSGLGAEVSLAAQGGLRAVVLRLAAIYGPALSAHQPARGAGRQLVRRALSRCLGDHRREGSEAGPWNTRGGIIQA